MLNFLAVALFGALLIVAFLFPGYRERLRFRRREARSSAKTRSGRGGPWKGRGR